MKIDSILFTNSKSLSEKLFWWHRYNNYWDEFKEDYRFYGYIARWKDCNVIHDWFVDNIQLGNNNGGIYELQFCDLIELKMYCQELLEKQKKVLGRDDWDDLKYTIACIQEIEKHVRHFDLSEEVQDEDDKDWICRFFYESIW